jgi:hypothetical protein
VAASDVPNFNSIHKYQHIKKLALLLLALFSAGLWLLLMCQTSTNVSFKTKYCHFPNLGGEKISCYQSTNPDGKFKPLNNPGIELGCQGFFKMSTTFGHTKLIRLHHSET